MKTFINYLFTTICILLLFACKKGLQTYSGVNAIYFSNSSDSSKITFAYDYLTKTDSTINVRVYSMGPVADVDRTFNLTFIDSLTTAKMDTNFTLLNNPVVIKAGMAFTNLKFKLYRTADLIKKTYVINLKLEPNENFTTDYSWDWSDLNTKKTRQLMIYTITFDDIFAQPKSWNVAFYGVFSRKKLYLMSDFFDIPIAKWNLTGTAGIPAVMVSSYGRVFQNYLSKEAAAGNIILDEDGTQMKMGASAQ